MKKPNPVKFSDLIKNDERISVEQGQINGKGRTRYYIQLQEGTALSPKRARYLAQWLGRAADYVEEKVSIEQAALQA